MTAPAPLPVPVPLALVLACASDRMAALIASRCRRGVAPRDPALVSLHGNRYFAQVAFRAVGQCDLIVPLDVWSRDVVQASDSGLAALRGMVTPEITPPPSGGA